MRSKGDQRRGRKKAEERIYSGGRKEYGKKVMERDRQEREGEEEMNSDLGIRMKKREDGRTKGQKSEREGDKGEGIQENRTE